MKLLFTTIGTKGSSELKEILGFLDADINFNAIKSDIITASIEVVELIGNTIYLSACDIFTKDNATEEEKNLLRAIQSPIAINAYTLFAPSNDLAHTNNGRKMRQDENEKLPFEWMLDKDNDNLQRRYFRSLDDLIKILDSLPDGAIKTAWLASESKVAMNNLIVKSTKEFDRFFPIKSRLLFLKLVPGMEDCEYFELNARVGKEKINLLKKANKNALSDSDSQLFLLLQKACVSYSLAWAMPRLSIGLFPNGVLQHYTSDRATTRGQKPALGNEAEVARQAFMSDFNKTINEIEKLLEPPIPNNSETQIIPSQKYGDKYFST